MEKVFLTRSIIKQNRKIVIKLEQSHQQNLIIEITDYDTMNMPANTCGMVYYCFIAE